jgi:hypothetical protein
MTSRVRCSCGRVYDPVKHMTCPDCGAESAVESVVVAEKIKPPVPSDLNSEWAQNSGSEPTQTTARREGRAQPTNLLKTLPWPVYAGAGAFVLAVLFFSLRPRHSDGLVKKEDVPVPVPTPVHEQASPTPSITIPPSAAPTVPPPTPASSAAPSFAPDAFQLDPRLTGAWETKGPWPPNSGRVQTVHWTIETDGRFTFSGPWSDAGAITASNGKMKWFSNNNNTGQPVDLTYEFNGDSLLTHGPLGDALWWRAKRSSKQSGRSTQRDKPRRYATPDDGVKREILRRVFRHFP